MNYPYPATSGERYTDINTGCQGSPNVHHIHGPSHKAVGTILFYAQAVDSALLVALGAISTRMSPSTVKKIQVVNQILDYCSTHAETMIKYLASNTVIQIHTDASYISETEAHSQAGGYFYLGSAHNNNDTNTLNGSIVVESTILHNVMPSVAKSELG